MKFLKWIFNTKTLLVLSLSANTYFYLQMNSKPNSKPEEMESDTTSSAPQSLMRKKTIIEVGEVEVDKIETKKAAISRSIPRQVPHEEPSNKVVEDSSRNKDLSLDEVDVLFDGEMIDMTEVTEHFEDAAKNYMRADLGLNNSDIEAYGKIKESFYQAREQFFKESFPNQDNAEVFIPSNEQMIQQTQILSKHLEQLRDVMGEKGFARYMSFVHRYNQELARTSIDDGTPVVMMDF